MKKWILSLLLLNFSLLIFNSSFAQIAIEWQRSLGGTGHDYAYSVQQTSDSGYIVAGYSKSNNGDVVGNHGSSDYWLVKLDDSGIIQWQKSLGGTGEDREYSIQQTADGGYVVAGHSVSNNGNVTGNHGGGDYWVVKLDSNGNIQWQKCLGGTDTDFAMSVQQTADGGYVVAGHSESNNGDITSNHGTEDYWVVKLDSSGNLQWQKCLGGTGIDRAFSIQQTYDGSYVVAGYSESNNGDVTGNHGGRDFWVVKLDSSGNLQWQKCFGGSGNDAAFSFQQTADGGYVIAGSSISNDGDVTGNHGSWDYWIVKIDGSGNLQWQKSLGGTDIEEASSVQQTFDGGYVVLGHTESNDSDVTGNHGLFDYWVIKLDGSGYIQWQKCLGGSGEDWAYSVRQTADGDYVVAGGSYSNDGDVTGNHGISDYWVVKLTEHYNGIIGTLYADFNSNNVQDPGESALANRKVFEQYTNRFGFSSATGEYTVFVLDSGNYNVAAEPVNYFTAAPVIHNAYFNTILQTDSLNDFAFQPNGTINDLCITISPATAFRAGMNATYVIHYENVGNTIINNCSVIFLPHSLVSYVGSSTAPFSVFPDSVIWNIGALTPFQSGSIVVTVNVQVGTPIGTLINSGVRIEPVAGDANPACNTHYWEVFTTGAVDPNDILVNRSMLFTYEFPNPPFLEYIIRFQNVGNDTAFTVEVYNPIDTTKLEINSLQYVSSSHPVDMQYVFHERYMKFTFNNILLPDSTTSEPMSHGFVHYKIKPKSSLVVNDSIRNAATIHFDFESPVLTNTALTTVELPTGLNNSLSPQDGITVWPNPVRENLSVGVKLSKATEVNIEVLNIFGQTVAAKILKGERGDNRFEMPLAELPSGVYVIKIDIKGNITQIKVIKL